MISMSFAARVFPREFIFLANRGPDNVEFCYVIFRNFIVSLSLLTTNVLDSAWVFKRVLNLVSSPLLPLKFVVARGSLLQLVH